MFAVIGGSGVEGLYEIIDEFEVATPFGNVTVFRVKTSTGPEAYFLLRHGRGYSVPPHRINYRANIWALKELKVKGVIATNAVGSLRRGLRPGTLLVPHDFLDFTKSRPFTFFDDKVVYTDVSQPYDHRIREALRKASRMLGLRVRMRGVYVVTEGPRYESPSEIRMFRKLGGWVVGMTGLPEVVLAKEVGLPYASLCVVTNYAAGMQSRVTHEEVERLMKSKIKDVKDLMDNTIKLLEEEGWS
jgi:5'-methylthioadenosine phosphorylase